MQQTKAISCSAQAREELYFNSLAEAGWYEEDLVFTYNFLVVSVILFGHAS